MRKAFSIALGVAVASVALLACGDDEPTGNGSGLNVAGTWTITETADGTDCGDGISTFTYTIGVAQSGSNITVTADGLTFSGTLSGNQLVWSGSYPEDGGTTTANVTMTIASDGNSLSGSSTWSWTDGIDSCTGTSTFSGVKS